jgi:cobalt-zinc-cadmium efflux system protein
MSGDCHDHAHHGHAHSKFHHPNSHESSGQSVANIRIAFALNLVFALVELVGGWWTGSIAIQADAVHDFGDSLVLLAALVLQQWSSSAARGRFTFGFRRLSLLSALGASFVILSGSIFVLWTAINRLMEPQTPHLVGMFWLALLGVAVNGYAAWRIGHGHTQNERALSWHMLEDLMGWVAVLVGSVVMRFYDIPWLDPVMSLVIAGFIILGSARSLWASSQLFLQAAPRLDVDGIRTRILSINGVSDVGALKIWSLDGVHHVASVHLTVPANLDVTSRSLLKKQTRDVFSNAGQFEVTVELEESNPT